MLETISATEWNFKQEEGASTMESETITWNWELEPQIPLNEGQLTPTVPQKRNRVKKKNGESEKESVQGQRNGLTNSQLEEEGEDRTSAPGSSDTFDDYSPPQSPNSRANGKKGPRTTYACKKHRSMHKRCPLECSERRTYPSSLEERMMEIEEKRQQKKSKDYKKSNGMIKKKSKSFENLLVRRASAPDLQANNSPKKPRVRSRSVSKEGEIPRLPPHLAQLYTPHYDPNEDSSSPSSSEDDGYSANVVPMEQEAIVGSFAGDFHTSTNVLAKPPKEEPRAPVQMPFVDHSFNWSEYEGTGWDEHQMWTHEERHRNPWEYDVNPNAHWDHQLDGMIETSPRAIPQNNVREHGDWMQEDLRVTTGLPSIFHSQPSVDLNQLALKLCVLRSTVEKWISQPYFNRLFPGFFVRICIMDQEPVYTIVRVLEVRDNCCEPYYLGKQLTTKGLAVVGKGGERVCSLVAVSNKPPLQHELIEWNEQFIRNMKMEQLKHKHEAFDFFNLRYTTDMPVDGK